MPLRPADYLPEEEITLKTTVSFYHNQDLQVYKLKFYTFLDYLGDIGGLFGAFNALFTGIVFILNYNGIYHLLTSILYKV